MATFRILRLGLRKSTVSVYRGRFHPTIAAVVVNKDGKSSLVTRPFTTSSDSGHQQSTNWRKSAAFFGAAAGLVGLTLYAKSQIDAQLASSSEEREAGSLVSGLPTYTLEDVGKHKTKDTRIWMTYKNGVYDVTEFVANHPGGSKILLAAGGAMDPFWNMYAVHKNKEVFSMLEELRIGNITEIPKEEERDASNPYANDPKRHPALRPSSSTPFNAEPPLQLLPDNFLTPNDLFFVRNHLPVPDVDPKTYKLEVGIDGASRKKNINLNDLKNRFQKKSVASIVQCAGNRRSEMVKIKSVKGLNWGAAAISNAEWAGVCLDDVLKYSGIDIDTVDCDHIIFDGLDQDPTGSTYGASIPIELARRLKKDIIVAYEMNGEDIPRDHGYPVRIVLPGIVGARQVKWLCKITLSKKESDCHWQQKDYKGFHASIDWHNVDFSTVPAIQELPVNSAICEPVNGSSLEEGSTDVTVKGYAWSGGGRGIVRVDVTTDGGKTWHSAELKHPDQPLYKTYAWTLWEATVPLPADKKDVEIQCKAVDSSYNVQPDNVDGIWNLRGVLSNAWFKVNVQVPGEKEEAKKKKTSWW
ncbi:sulfite oxidase-like [Pecten maximus]|uniref:sulfite oxidase-like n=1 Tax=Pecten maximus TaxID=6579 RepID=UPI001458CEED|nr:sulfite oxidase-like [Pecten maximus]